MSIIKRSAIGLLVLTLSAVFVACGKEPETSIDKAETEPPVEAQESVEPEEEVKPQEAEEQQEQPKETESVDMVELTPAEEIEQVVEEPVIEEPVTEEPVVKEPEVKEEPVVEQPKRTGLMTPYPSEYPYMPKEYNKQDILDWYSTVDLWTQAESIVGWADAPNHAYMGTNTLVACAEYCVDKGYNPWCVYDTGLGTTFVGNALMRTNNFDNTSDLGDLDNLDFYTQSFDDDCKMCIKEYSKYNEFIDEPAMIYDARVPQDVADACHAGK